MQFHGNPLWIVRSIYADQWMFYEYRPCGSQKKNLMQNVQNALLHSSYYRMNEQDEQDFWMELFAVTVRYEQRRDATLQADMEKSAEESSADIANLAKTNHNLFSDRP